MADDLRPNLIILGASKSATSSLHEMLRAHPQVEMTTPKELNVFASPDWQQRLSRYRGQFTGAAVIRGEGTPLYLHARNGPERMAAACGADLRLIAILRHPTDRAYSHYWHSVRLAKETATFEQALRLEPVRTARSFDSWRSFSYAPRGHYDAYLAPWRDRFGDRLLVLSMRDLTSDASATMSKTYAFLGVDGDGRTDGGEAVQKNAARRPRTGAGVRLAAALERRGLGVASRIVRRANLRIAPYPPMDPVVRRTLDDHFEGTIARVAATYSVDLRREREGEAVQRCSRTFDLPPVNATYWPEPNDGDEA